MCKFDLAWIGPCNKECSGDFCLEHLGTKCSVCGKQAIKECPETSSLVCGYPLCKTCECNCRVVGRRTVIEYTIHNIAKELNVKWNRYQDCDVVKKAIEKLFESYEKAKDEYQQRLDRK